MVTNHSRSTTQPSNIDELVNFVVEAVREQFDSTGRRLDGSFLAHLVRNRYPEIDYAQLGLTKLGDAVRIAENSGRIVRHTDVRHLEVSPAARQGGAEPAQERKQEPERVYVRPDVWRAFVFPSAGTVYVDRASGEIVRQAHGPSSSAPYNAVAVDPVTDQHQLEWASQFLNSRPELSGHTERDRLALVHGGATQFGSSVSRAWKTFRSAQVIAHIRRWAEANSVSTEEIIVQADKSARRPVRTAYNIGRSDLRRTLIEYIEKMPTADLEELALSLTQHVLQRSLPK